MAAAWKPASEDVQCPICLEILIEPVVLPCAHELCMPCFREHIDKTSLQCPICRCRISCWAREASRKKELINRERWEFLQKNYPKQIRNRKLGIESRNASYASLSPQLVLAEPGEIHKEYLEERKKADQEREEEREREEEASRALIERLQKDEETAMKQIVESDALVAEHLQSLNDSNLSTTAVQNIREEVDSRTNAYTNYQQVVEHPRKTPNEPQNKTSQIDALSDSQFVVHTNPDEIFGYEPSQKPEHSKKHGGGIVYAQKDVTEFEKIVEEERLKLSLFSDSVLDDEVVNNEPSSGAVHTGPAVASAIPPIDDEEEEVEESQSIQDDSMTSFDNQAAIPDTFDGQGHLKDFQNSSYQAEHSSSKSLPKIKDTKESIRTGVGPELELDETISKVLKRYRMKSTSLVDRYKRACGAVLSGKRSLKEACKEEELNLVEVTPVIESVKELLGQKCEGNGEYNMEEEESPLDVSPGPVSRRRSSSHGPSTSNASRRNLDNLRSVSADLFELGSIGSQELSRRRMHKLSMSTKSLFEDSPVEGQTEKAENSISEENVEDSAIVVPETPPLGTINLSSSSVSLNDSRVASFKPISAAPVTPPKKQSDGRPIANKLVRIEPIRLPHVTDDSGNESETNSKRIPANKRSAKNNKSSSQSAPENEKRAAFISARSDDNETQQVEGKVYRMKRQVAASSCEGSQSKKKIEPDLLPDCVPETPPFEGEEMLDQQLNDDEEEESLNLELSSSMVEPTQNVTNGMEDYAEEEEQDVDDGRLSKLSEDFSGNRNSKVGEKETGSKKEKETMAKKCRQNYSHENMTDDSPSQKVISTESLDCSSVLDSSVPQKRSAKGLPSKSDETKRSSGSKRAATKKRSSENIPSLKTGAKRLKNDKYSVVAADVQKSVEDKFSQKDAVPPEKMAESISGKRARTPSRKVIEAMAQRDSCGAKKRGVSEEEKGASLPAEKGKSSEMQSSRAASSSPERNVTVRNSRGNAFTTAKKEKATKSRDVPKLPEPLVRTNRRLRITRTSEASKKKPVKPTGRKKEALETDDASILVEVAIRRTRARETIHSSASKSSSWSEDEETPSDSSTIAGRLKSALKGEKKPRHFVKQRLRFGSESKVKESGRKKQDERSKGKDSESGSASKKESLLFRKKSTKSSTPAKTPKRRRTPAKGEKTKADDQTNPQSQITDSNANVTKTRYMKNEKPAAGKMPRGRSSSKCRRTPDNSTLDKREPPQGRSDTVEVKRPAKGRSKSTPRSVSASAKPKSKGPRSASSGRKGLAGTSEEAELTEDKKFALELQKKFDLEARGVLVERMKGEKNEYEFRKKRAK